MTDKQVDEINKRIKECKNRGTFDICRLQVLPCSRVIDKGKCPVICDYLANKEVDNG